MIVEIPESDAPMVKDALSRFVFEASRYREREADACARVIEQL